MIQAKLKTLVTISFLMISVCGFANDRNDRSERENRSSQSSPAASCKDYQFLVER